MPRRSAQVRTRRSIWPRLYWSRSTPQSAADLLAEGDVVVGGLRPAVRPGTAGASRGGRSASVECVTRLSGDRGGQLVERQDLVGQAGLGDRARHAVDGAGGLGLDEDAAAGGLDGAGAVEAVLAHAGQHDQQQARAVDARRRRRS